jgi:hypothetical protein
MRIHVSCTIRKCSWQFDVCYGISQSVIHLAKNQVHHARTKHIDIRFHFIREIIDNGQMSLQKVETKDNPTDMLTKIVPAIKFNHCLDLINILHA